MRRKLRRKSTLGRNLAQKLGCNFMDIEDYYFPETGTDYIYAGARTKEEVSDLLLEDMKRYHNSILASVKGDYDGEVEAMFTCAVLVSVPKAVRLKRVKDRSFQKFGDRVLLNGDLYEKEKRFLDMVERRSGQETEDWLQSVNILIIYVDGENSIAYNTEKIVRFLHDRQLDIPLPVG